MQMNELLRRFRRQQKAVAAGGHLAQPHTDRQDQIGFAHPSRQLRIDADADIAGIQGVVIVKRILEAKSAGDR